MGRIGISEGLGSRRVLWFWDGLRLRDGSGFRAFHLGLRGFWGVGGLLGHRGFAMGRFKVIVVWGVRSFLYRFSGEQGCQGLRVQRLERLY